MRRSGLLLLLVVPIACGGHDAGGGGGTPPTGEPIDTFDDYVLDPETYFEPADNSLLLSVTTNGETWQYPSNHLLVELADGYGRTDADAIATSISGEVVGQVPLISLYQVKIPTATQAELDTARATVAAAAGVDAVFFNVRAKMFAGDPPCPADCDLDKLKELARCPYDDAGYYQTLAMIDELRPHITFSPVRIGVVDTGIKTSLFNSIPILNADNPGKPIPKVRLEDPQHPGTFILDDTHGTAVASVIAAPDGNDTVNGQASRMLRDRMSLVWGGGTGKGDAGLVEYIGAAMSWLVSTKRVADAKPKVINMSIGWGHNAPDVAGIRGAFSRLFNKYGDYPLFVIAAPNDATPYDLTDTNTAPAGIQGPNVLTVGGTMLCDPESAAGLSTTGPLIDLAATAIGVSILRPTGSVELENGNSLAAPQVASAALVMVSIHPISPASFLKQLLKDNAAPTSLEVGGRRLLWSAALVTTLTEASTDATVKDIVDRDRNNIADPVGLALSRMCGGLTYRVSQYGSYNSTNSDDEMRGNIYETSFGFVAVPTGDPGVSGGCEGCVVDVAEYPMSDSLTPGTMTLSWTQNQEDPMSDTGYTTAGAFKVEECRIDERNALTNDPLMVTLRGTMNGSMLIGQPMNMTEHTMEGFFNVPFNTLGVPQGSPIFVTFENKCEMGNAAP